MKNRGADGDLRRPCERPSPSSKLIEQDADAEKIALKGCRLPIELLWRNVRTGSGENSHGRLEKRRAGYLGQLRKSKIEHFHNAFRPNHHVFRFNVAMNEESIRRSV